MRAKIKERKEIAEGTTAFILDLNGQDANFKAGQFFQMTLLNPPYTDEKGNQRFFGYVNSPTQKGIIEFATRNGISAFKKSLMELPIGTEVEVGEAQGHIVLPDDTSKPIVIVTGGIAIAPILSILRYVKDKSLPYKITLIHSSRNKAWTLYFDELQMLVNNIPEFKLIQTMTQDPEWQGERRKIDVQFIKDYIPNINENSYCVTGTIRFVPSIVKVLRDAGVEPLNIKMEILTGY